MLVLRFCKIAVFCSDIKQCRVNSARTAGLLLLVFTWPRFAARVAAEAQRSQGAQTVSLTVDATLAWPTCDLLSIKV